MSIHNILLYVETYITKILAWKFDAKIRLIIWRKKEETIQQKF